MCKHTLTLALCIYLFVLFPDTSAAQKTNGYTNSTEACFGFLTGSYTDNEHSFGIQTVNGYMFAPWISFGAGIGYNTYSGMSFLPIFGDLRLNIDGDKVIPYFDFAAGQSISLDKNDEFSHITGGLMFSAGFGLRFPVSEKFALNLGGSYKQQQFDLNGKLNTIEIRFGFTI